MPPDARRATRGIKAAGETRALLAYFRTAARRDASLKATKAMGSAGILFHFLHEPMARAIASLGRAETEDVGRAGARVRKEVAAAAREIGAREAKAGAEPA